MEGSDMFETESKARPDGRGELGRYRPNSEAVVARPLMKPIASQMSLPAVVPAVHIAPCHGPSSWRGTPDDESVASSGDTTWWFSRDGGPFLLIVLGLPIAEFSA